MLAARSLYSSFLDFIENTRAGSGAFRLARFGLFALAIFVASRVASRQFLSFTFSDVLFMALTALAFLLVFWRWEIGIVLVLCTTSFIFYFDYLPTLSLYHFIPEIPVLEQLRLQIGQGIMLYLLALFATSLELGSMRRRLATPLTPAVLIFMLVITFAAISGLVYKGVYLVRVVEATRIFSYYLMFFVALLCIRGRRELKVLLVASYIMALVVAVLMFVQFAAGEKFKVFPGSNIRVESFGARAGRILPPGSDLIWLAIPFVITRIPISSPRVRKLMTFSLGILLGGLLLTFTRTVWISTLMSMTIIAILGRGEIRRSTLHMFAAMAAFIAFLLVVLSLVSTEEESYVTPYIKRFTSIFHPETYGENTSAGAREFEIKEAWPKIVQNPWLGIGVGGIYRYEQAWDDPTQAHYLKPVYYMHNAYGLMLTDAGVLGLGACLIMYITFFVRARKIYFGLKKPEEQGIVLACIASVASVMLGAVMQPTLAASHDVPMIGLMFGIVELLRYFSIEESLQPGRVRRPVALVHRRHHLSVSSRSA